MNGAAGFGNTSPLLKKSRMKLLKSFPQTTTWPPYLEWIAERRLIRMDNTRRVSSSRHRCITKRSELERGSIGIAAAYLRHRPAGWFE
jgi:hypothetical protein